MAVAPPPAHPPKGGALGGRKGVMVGVLVIGGAAAYLWWRNKQASNAASTSSTTTAPPVDMTGSSGIDPNTGLSYASEGFGAGNYLGMGPSVLPALYPGQGLVPPGSSSAGAVPTATVTPTISSSTTPGVASSTATSAPSTYSAPVSTSTATSTPVSSGYEGTSVPASTGTMSLPLSTEGSPIASPVSAYSASNNAIAAGDVQKTASGGYVYGVSPTAAPYTGPTFNGVPLESITTTPAATGFQGDIARPIFNTSTPAVPASSSSTASGSASVAVPTPSGTVYMTPAQVQAYVNQTGGTVDSNGQFFKAA